MEDIKKDNPIQEHETEPETNAGSADFCEENKSKKNRIKVILLLLVFVVIFLIKAVKRDQIAIYDLVFPFLFILTGFEPSDYEKNTR